MYVKGEEIRTGGMRRRRRRFRFKFLLFGILGCLLIAGIVWFIFHKREESRPLMVPISITEEVSAKAYAWLNQVDDTGLSYEDVRNIMGELQLMVVFTPTLQRGHYMQELQKGTYDSCAQSAWESFELAYRQVMKNRLKAEGYPGECTDDRLDALMKEAYGMTVSEYLATCEISLMPDWDQLSARYSGEVDRED